jgi:hypothetical protein
MRIENIWVLKNDLKAIENFITKCVMLLAAYAFGNMPQVLIRLASLKNARGEQWMRTAHKPINICEYFTFIKKLMSLHQHNPNPNINE